MVAQSSRDLAAAVSVEEGAEVEEEEVPPAVVVAAAGVEVVAELKSTLTFCRTWA